MTAVWGWAVGDMPATSSGLGTIETSFLGVAGYDNRELAMLLVPALFMPPDKGDIYISMKNNRVRRKI